jgi:malonyl-CoA/methylmalonyl-CoA synthetase
MGAPRSLLAALLAAAARGPERSLLRFEGTVLSYGGVADAAARAGAALVRRGVAPGDRVALFLESSPGFVVAYLGAFFARAVVVPVNPAYREVELAHLLADAGVTLCVVDAPRAALIAELGARGVLPGLGHPAIVTADDLLGEDAPPLAPPDLGEDDLAVIGYTSGTTGRAKGAMLTHGNFTSNAAAVTAAWGWTAADRLLLTLPLFHMHGLGVGLHGTLVAGSSIDLWRRFDAPAVLAELRRGAITMFFGVPTMIARLLAAAEAQGGHPPTGAVRLFVSGSAPLPAATFAAFARAFGQEILERYGMTETVMIAGNPLAGPRRPGQVGRPFPGVEIRVVHPRTRAPLPAGETGEVEVRGPGVARGYWRDAAATRAAFGAEGWFSTGDLGHRGDDGSFTLSGRARELIISGGFNVYPREVEDVLAAHPGVAEAAVLGLPDADLGEAVTAVVVRRDPTLTGQALVEHCRARLAAFKKPRLVRFVDALPRNAMGKVQKHLLREQLAGGAEDGGDAAPARLDVARPTGGE